MKGTRDLKQWEARRKRGVELYKKGWYQHEIAEVLGVTQPSVSKWVRAEATMGEEALKKWKNQEWPRIKKTPKRAARR
jgi:predicted transcriptional regulator